MPIAEDTPPADARPASSWSWPNFTRNAVVTAAVIGLGAWFVIAAVVPNVSPKNFGVVREGQLYRSGVLTPASLAGVIEDHDIRTIVDLGGHLRDSRSEQREIDTADAMGVRYVYLPLFGDGTGDPNMYAEALRIINDPANQPVLVHCSAGSERTGGLVTLYRHIEQGVPLNEAYAECPNFGHDPSKNTVLRPMLDTWAGAIAESVRTGEPIAYDGATAAIPPADPAPTGADGG
ncbi:MAG: hypothetical protein DHS20C14_07960 [Phycisphaeraceae bacterium]|nr:MAG: hypothetical protein DHS20C14_07960 [Phycisphaeraceae bacterium]